MNKNPTSDTELVIVTSNDKNKSNLHENQKLNPTKSYLGEAKKMQDYGSNQQIISQAQEQTEWSCCEIFLLTLAWLWVIVIPLYWLSLYRTVKDYERALIFRLGKLTGGAKGPGVFFVNPIIDKIVIIDLRVATFNLNPQEMMTADNVTVTVDAISFMKVIDPLRAVLEIDDYQKAFSLFSATTLRSVIGQYDLTALLSDRNEINDRVRSIIEEETNNWGVTVPAVEIKDVKLPHNMQRAMAAEAEADRERKAKIISAKGEADASKMLAKAASEIADSPGALQLRYLHTLVKISAEKNSTILFPLPMEIMRGMQAIANVGNLAKFNQNI